MKTFCILNRKGGTGKTTLAVNVAAILSNGDFNKKELKRKKEPPFRVLLIDLDAQGNATGTLRAVYKDKASLYDVLTGKADIRSAIHETPFENLSVLQGNLNLDLAEEELQDAEAKEFILKRKLDQIKNDFDYVFLDCPPGRSVLTNNALTAADYVLIPVEATKYALDGINMMASFISEIQTKYNVNLKVGGVVIVKKERSSAQDGYATVIREYLPYHVFNQTIRKSTIAEQSIASSTPLLYYQKSASITKDFIDLTKEIQYIAQEA